MAKATLDPLIKSISGKLDGAVYSTSPNGKTRISKSPHLSKVKWSKAQKQSRQRFQAASKYARAALADPDLRAIYEERAAAEHRVPYRVALSDYLKGKDLLSG